MNAVGGLLLTYTQIIVPQATLMSDHVVTSHTASPCSETLPNQYAALQSAIDPRQGRYNYNSVTKGEWPTDAEMDVTSVPCYQFSTS